MLAAELRDKTRSLGRAEGTLGAQGPREKPAPPQKAKRSVLSASPAPAPEAPGPEKTADGAPLPDTPRKKTPIQKPPRKKSREAAGELGRVGAPTL